ncbi:MAG: cytochrome c oxidase assembly protein [Jatrophihabitantaceae bacterium]
MNIISQHWSTDPFDLLVLLVVSIHGRGLRARLRSIRRANRPTEPWIQQAVLFYAGLGVLIVAVTSPIDYWSDQYLSVHIVQHLMLAFFAPPLIVLGAPWLPLMRGLPRSLRRDLGRLAQLTRSGRPGSTGPVRRLLTSARRLLSRPITAVLLFNAAMVFWHFPGPFDAALHNQAVHIWLEHASFFAFGMALWLQVFGSYPLRPVLDGPRRVAVLIATNAVMVIVAMTLVMFTKAIYSGYAPVHTLSQRAADQQIGGAILWVCGEISFLPAILYTVMRWLDTDADQAPPGTPRPAPARQPVAPGPSI